VALSQRNLIFRFGEPLRKGAEPQRKSKENGSKKLGVTFAV